MRIALVLASLFSISMFAGDVEGLRRGGQSSVDMLHAKSNGAPDALLDRVCAQKDCHTSRLFWYTDLGEAQDAARALGRPILSLHLLGRLDEELSCANSRFFRVMLYSDPEIASILRERYVLHWHSVRPVPRVTIDMGDGRKIQQTITGNSVHYLLGENGEVLDALPGLHSPRAFRAQLEEWLTLDPAQLREYHALRAKAALDRGLSLGFVQIKQRVPRNPTAQEVVRQAASKARTERPLLTQLTIGLRPPAEESMPVSDDVTFSAESLALMRRKQPLTDELMESLRRSVATDTVFNDVELHRHIHQWFAAGEVEDLASLNERVYAELFLTPSDDPWLGLNPESVFTAIGE
jgi:hypothetical protein